MVNNILIHVTQSRMLSRQADSKSMYASRILAVGPSIPNTAHTMQTLGKHTTEKKEKA